MRAPCLTVHRITGTVLFEIIQAKGRLANTAPRIILNLPRLPAQKGLPSTAFGAFVANIAAKVSADKIVSVVDIELAQEKFDGPLCILDMEDAQDGFAVSFRVGIHPTEVFEVINFLGGHFAHADLTLI